MNNKCRVCGDLVIPAKRYGGGFWINEKTGEIRPFCRKHYKAAKANLEFDRQSVHPSYEDWSVAKWDEVMEGDK